MTLQSLGAGCGGGGGGGAGGAGADGAGRVADVPEASASAENGGDPVSPEPAPAGVLPAETPAGAASGDGPPAGADSTDIVPVAPPPSLDADVAVGRFSPAYLRPDLSRAILVEVRAQQGLALPASALEHLELVLEATTGKPVSVRTDQQLTAGDTSWTRERMVEVAAGPAVTPQGVDGVAVLRLLVLRGSFQGDDSVLGVAVRGDLAAVFLERVHQSAPVLSGPERLATAVATHEVGHLLGLVDLYLATGRADPSHPGHSSNPESVMYWAVESSLVGSVLGGGPPIEFDAADRADLAAIAASR